MLLPYTQRGLYADIMLFPQHTKMPMIHIHHAFAPTHKEAHNTHTSCFCPNTKEAHNTHTSCFCPNTKEAHNTHTSCFCPNTKEAHNTYIMLLPQHTKRPITHIHHTFAPTHKEAHNTHIHHTFAPTHKEAHNTHTSCFSPVHKVAHNIHTSPTFRFLQSILSCLLNCNCSDTCRKFLYSLGSDDVADGGELLKLLWEPVLDMVDIPLSGVAKSSDQFL